MITRRRALAASFFTPWASWAQPAGAFAGDGELVRLLVETPRESLLDALAMRIRAGLAPQQLLAALAVATCREVSPYPNVGFKYHAVMMLRSVEQSVVAMPNEHKWLPLLWTADYFKAASAQQDRIEPWSLRPLPEGHRSDGHSQPAALAGALVSWDAQEADLATADLVAAGHTRTALQTLMLHAARDFRAIGHKPIAAANAHRLVSALGEGVAAPLARSLALAVQNAEGDANPARYEHVADRDWQANQAMAATLPLDWQAGRDDISAARTLLQEMRTASSEQAVGTAIRLLADNISAHTVWEAVTMFAAELILRRNGIVALHASTAANAMHYCYRAADEDHARRLQLLQAVAFMTSFRSMVERDSRTRNRRIDAIAPMQAENLDEIFQTAGRNRIDAVRQARGWLEAGGDAMALGARTRWYATLKNRGTHDIKFTEAMLENYRWLRLPWRDDLLAASLMYANGSADQDDHVVARARTLLGV
ncbi:MAG: hypothetical protein OXI79_12935 [Gammaproteobacteria bacterium]|nr:hypothetical protein [Gammaproteobacteria bacterium]